MKKSLILLVVLLASQSAAMASAEKLGWRPSVSFGYGLTQTTQSQTLHLMDTPDPGLDNRYVGSRTIHDATFVGLSLEKEFATSFVNAFTAVGFELDYLWNQHAGGVVEPMVNVSPDFDVLNYSYHIQSFVAQATGKLLKKDLLNHLDGYLQAGVGASFNRLSRYHESSPEGSSAAPMLNPFGSKDTVRPAISAGLGVSSKIGQRQVRMSLGYRYFYTGASRLTTTPVQQTYDVIRLSTINHHFLTLSLTM